MIRVQYKTHKKVFVSLDITGHAESNEYGLDLICSAASAIGFGTLNAIDEMLKDTCQLEVLDNHMLVVVKQDSKTLQNILATSYYQFKTLEEEYEDYVKVTKMEVKSHEI